MSWKKEGRERSAARDREEWRLRQCGVEVSEWVGLNWKKEKGKRVKIERTEMRLKRVLAYLIAVTWLAEIHGLWVGDRPDTVSIVAIDPS